MKSLCDQGAPVGAGFVCRDNNDDEYSIVSWDYWTDTVTVLCRYHGVECDMSPAKLGLYWR